MTSCVKKFLLLLNIALFIVMVSSKYDMEAAALKHYGVSFHSVLNNFRRSPNYWKILYDKMEDIKMTMKDNEDYHKQFFVVHELRDRVDAILGRKDGGNTTQGRNSLGVNKMMRHNIRRFVPTYRRQGESDQPLPMIVVNRTVVNTLESLPLLLTGGLERKTMNRIIDDMFNMTLKMVNHLTESVGGSSSIPAASGTSKPASAARIRVGHSTRPLRNQTFRPSPIFRLD